MQTRLISRLLVCVWLAAFSTQLTAQEPDAETKAKIAQRDQLWKQAMTLAQQGKLADAAQQAEEVYKLEETIFGSAHSELLGTLNLLCQIAKGSQNETALIGYRERQQVVTENLYGKDDYRAHDAARAVNDAKQRSAFTPEQKAKLAEADSLHSQMMQSYQKGQYEDGVRAATECLAIRRQVLGDTHPDYANGLHNLARSYYSMGDYSRAELLLREATVIMEKVLGKKHPDYALKLYSLASFYESISDYPRAEPLYNEAIVIQEKVLGAEHPDYATSLNSLALLYRSMGDYQRAEPLFRESIVIREKVLGKEHPNYALSLHSLGAMYRSMGDYQQAESLFREAMAIREKVLGKEHPDYASSLNSLAVLYRSMGNYPRAEPLYREAIVIQEKVLGKENPSYATSLNNLALLYISMGDYPRAEPLYQEAIVIQEKVLGKEHPSYATSLNNLAEFYCSMGDYPRAEPLYNEAIVILEKVLGKEHPSYATILNNLFELYHSMGDYPRAYPLMLEVMAIREKVLGKEHPDYAASLNNLAALYRSMGDYTRAEPLYCEANAIWEKVLGKEHPHYAASLNNLAGLYCSMGDYPRAEPLYREAIVIDEKVLGKQHPEYAKSLKNLAALFDSMGDYARADQRYREAVEITLANLERTADVQSERQQVLMGESLRGNLDGYLSLATRESKFQEPAYAAVLRWKGSVWQRQLRQQALRDQPSLQPGFVALQDASSKLSTLILNPPSDVKQRDSWKQRLEQLTDEREKLQRDLSLASIEFRESQQPVTPDQLRQSLPEGTILIDFLEFTQLTPANKEHQTKDAWERRLLVHLVRAGETVQAIDLGPIKTLNALVQTWRKDLGESREAADAAQELRNRIWAPIESQLSGITTVYVSPDGLLGQFPLAALPGKRPGSYLLEELAIIQLPVPQGLPAMAKQTEVTSSTENNRFCLVGGVDYEKVSTGETPSSSNTDSNTDSVPSGPLLLAARGGEWHAFGALPGTAAEIDKIQSLVRQYRPTAQTTILRGEAASEAAFAKIAAKHRFLHVATHGFFAPESVQNALNTAMPDANRMLGLEKARAPRVVGQHPDLLSGLVFAGANQEPSSGAEDGILTAAEVQKLDLRGVELAVLSACETGLGRTAGGEGIIGLQRAFQLAGAKTTITSLWQVDDAATRALMVKFYQNLFDKKFSKLESLRQAQIWMLNNPDAIKGRDLTTRGEVRPTKALTADPKATSNTPIRSVPGYWAAFQLSGDPR